MNYSWIIHGVHHYIYKGHVAMLLLLFLISKIYSMTKLQQVVLYCVAWPGPALYGMGPNCSLYNLQYVVVYLYLNIRE
jgi:hypothetical protein